MRLKGVRLLGSENAETIFETDGELGEQVVPSCCKLQSTLKNSKVQKLMFSQQVDTSGTYI